MNTMISDAATDSAIRDASWYRAVWRVHFVAGLLSLPFLVLLAVTGALYLFHDEIDGWFYRDFDRVAVRTGGLFSVGALVAHAERATDGRVVIVTVPDERERPRAVRMGIATPSGELETAFMDPYNADLRGTAPYGGIMQLVRKVHSLQIIGPRASWLVESAAGWSIVLVITGIYLWWPRGRSGGVVSVRGPLRRRMFWRDLHAVVGLLTAVVILFLAVTGMPWSDVWGGAVQAWATQRNLSRPPAPADVPADWELATAATGRGAAPPPPAGHAGHHAAKAPPNSLPWAIEKSVMPSSTAPSEGEVLTFDDAIDRFDRAGLSRPYTVMPPLRDNGAWVGTRSPRVVEGTRIVYLDRNDGHVLDDVGYARFGPAAKAIEWGIAVHQGEEFGSVNRYVMLAGCVAILLLVVSAAVMWWKRRPWVALGMPPKPRDAHKQRLVIAMLVPVGVIYPLVGVTLVIVVGATVLSKRWRVRPRSA